MSPTSLYALAIALSAFLLFQVQLVTAKWLLPWFGGVPAVWIACMVVFQCLLLAGYAYAHLLGLRMSARGQRRVHLAVLAAAVALLAIQVAAWRQPLLAPEPAAGALAPTARILVVLALSVGLPFLVLSATNPLMQRWFRAAHPALSPWRLFAASNLGSLLGLLSYPFLTEPWLTLDAQAWTWSVAFLATAALLAHASRNAATGTPAREIVEPYANRADWLMWFALSACGAALLVGTSARLAHDVATIPLLWILPLALYLLSFILTFESDRYYPAAAWSPALLATFACVTLLLDRGLAAGPVTQVALYGAALFVGCMVCHGELARTRPAPGQLTIYYLWIAAGGAAGGLLAGAVAPFVLHDLWELNAALVACAALWLIAQLRAGGGAYPVARAPQALAALATTAAIAALLVAGDEMPESVTQALFPLAVLCAGSALAVLAWRRWGAARTWLVLSVAVFASTHAFIAASDGVGVISAARNFFGTVSIVEEDRDKPGMHVYKLRHGRIVHGIQWQAPERRAQVAAYYTRDSGIAQAWRHQSDLDDAVEGSGLRVGVIGLGAGSLAAYGLPGDSLRFYEINPAVVHMASGPGAPFTFLRDSAARSTVIVDDGRLALARELAASGPGQFDLLVVDAFNGHAIPMHLLTLEAVDLYLAHLAPDQGVLALHITNQYLDLDPVVRRIAAERNLSLRIVTRSEADADGWPNTWALLARVPAALPGTASVPAVEPAAPLWTDRHSALWPAVRLAHPGHEPLIAPDCEHIDCPSLTEPLAL